MSYYDEVFLKRMNKGGTTQQDRIKTRKENEFNRLFLKKTEYKVCLYGINGEQSNITCSLQPNKWNESSLISNLLMPTSAPPLKTGDVLNIKQKIKEAEQDKIWLVIFVEENLTKGYQLFKIICLDDEVNIADEYGNTIQNLPVKFINNTSTFVRDTFEIRVGYREPNSSKSFVTSDFEILKKGQFFNYKDRTWEIQGKDNISIDNVAYVFINEKLKTEAEPLSSKDLEVGEDINFFLNGR